MFFYVYKNDQHISMHAGQKRRKCIHAAYLLHIYVRTDVAVILHLADGERIFLSARHKKTLLVRLHRSVGDAPR
jgi:hypothetical protein